MQTGRTDRIGSFDMRIGDTHTNFQRMVAKQGAARSEAKVRQGSFVGKDCSFDRSFVRPKQGAAKINCSSDRSFVQ